MNTSPEEAITYGIDDGSTSGDETALTVKKGSKVWTYVGEEAETLLALLREAEVAARRSQTDHLFSVIRHCGFKIDQKAVMRLSKQWNASAEAARKAQLSKPQGANYE